MGYLLKLALLGSLGLTALKAPLPGNFSLSNILNQPQILGESVAIPYPYPNASVVKDNGTIYFIYGTTKIPFANYKAFTGLGYSARNVVSGDLANYDLAQGYIISSANIAHPWGSWVSNKGAIYYSSPDGLIAVPSAESFLSNGGQWNLVVKANKYDLALLRGGAPLDILSDNDPRVAGQPVLKFGGPTAQNNPSPAPPVPPPANTGSNATTTGATTTAVSYAPQITLPAQLYSGASLTVTATSVDPNLPLVYTFFWGDGTSNSLTKNYAVHIYSAAGNYTLGVSIADSQGNTASSSVTAAVTLPPNVNPTPPQITLPTGATVGTQLTVTALSSDPGGLTLTYTFAWGDGSADTVAAGNSATHTYTSSNTFIVKVTATDSQGYSNFSNTYLYVKAQ